MLRFLGQIRVRLLVVNLVVLLVPMVGLEFARIYERQLLASLERDMRNQATLARELIESSLEAGDAIDHPRHQRVLEAAARHTRTRVRILDGAGLSVVDSHAEGPPEGPEPPAPTILPSSAQPRAIARRTRASSPEVADVVSSYGPPTVRWPDVPNRPEVRNALEGHPDSFTRIRDSAPAVLLFLPEPIRHEGQVAGVVYVTRSTRPVLAELYKIRTGLIEVLIVAMALTLFLTLLLSWSISRPLSRLARVARRIAEGDAEASVAVEGSGEVRELGEAFKTMTERLDARMRYIREFAADMGHELKSPLTSIRGAAELLQEGADDDPEARQRFLSNIELDVERLDRLVYRLLELSRIDSSVEPFDDFDLGAMLERVVERTHSVEAPVEVHWQTPLRRWRGRERDLERALLNLVENALRFSPEGEPVTVLVEVSRDGRQLALRVRDRGPGVPEANRAKIFERFFTTDADRNGTGLGLAIVQSVAAAHRGRVELISEEGVGAQFSIVLSK